MKFCELCKGLARTYCESDQASLCWNCDVKVHGANFLVARHSRTVLCHACQSPTPWKASGAELGITVSVCESCVVGGRNTAQRDDEESQGGNDDEIGTDDDDDLDDDDEDENDHGGEDHDYDDDDDDEEEEEEEVGGDDDENVDNQVVPWTAISSETAATPPPAANSSSSSMTTTRMRTITVEEEEEEVGGDDDENVDNQVVPWTAISSETAATPPPAANSSSSEESVSRFANGGGEVSGALSLTSDPTSQDHLDHSCKRRNSSAATSPAGWSGIDGGDASVESMPLKGFKSGSGFPGQAQPKSFIESLREFRRRDTRNLSG
ncbi:Putative zinc finger protein [Morus notabilis]|uniref:Putative zinc finger protein n=1 Tax=Morus notabilis TaxID=981085 RepID=W9R0D1_9ROSA|nr:Putative zinc finger protein [Morus notabilis]